MYENEEDSQAEEFFEAVYKKDLIKIKSLVENKADVTANDNEAVLMSYDNMEILKFLVSSKADITAQDNETILNADHNDSIDVVEYLISLGADINKVCKRTRNILIMRKYFRRWRKVVFKSFFRKVLIPLYYSVNFPGHFKERKNLENLFTN